MIFPISDGLPRKNKFVALDTAGTVVVWSPSTSTCIRLDGLTVSSLLGGTIEFYWGNLGNLSKNAIVAFCVGGSTTISPIIQPITNPVMDQALYVNVNTGASYKSWFITATGVEIALN